MLIKSRRDNAFRSRGPVGLPRTARLAASSPYAGMYLRPNPSANGATPCSDPVCASPDIWIAGQAAVPNYTTALATTDSYATESPGNVSQGEQNIIYVRGMNGQSSNVSQTVTLYYSPSGVIQQPSKWQNNIIPTDQGAQNGNIPSTAPGSIGVCTSTFLWSNPQTPPPGSDHYCLFAQFNDSNNSNPFPNVESVFDMASLIRNDLMWGWRNVSLIPGTGATWQVSEPVIIPENYPAQHYQLVVTPTGGWANWSVEFYSSEADSNGNPVNFPRTTITQPGVTLGLSNVFLDPGWQGQITVNLYSPDGSSPTPGWSMPLACNFIASGASDIKEALHRGLIDFDYHRRLRRHCPELFVGIGPTAFLQQGTYTGKVDNSTQVRAWYEKQGNKS